jgi:hypothetical protein
MYRKSRIWISPATTVDDADFKRVYKNNKSGVVGVSYDKRNKLWVARVLLNDRTIWCGRHNSISKAVASQTAALKGLRTKRSWST